MHILSEVYRNSQPFAFMLKGSMSKTKTNKKQAGRGWLCLDIIIIIVCTPPPPLSYWREGSQFLEGGCWGSGGEDSNNGVNNNMLTLVNRSRGLL